MERVNSIAPVEQVSTDAGRKTRAVVDRHDARLYKEYGRYILLKRSPVNGAI